MQYVIEHIVPVVLSWTLSSDFAAERTKKYYAVWKGDVDIEWGFM
jgi:hypothetical protein